MEGRKCWNDADDFFEDVLNGYAKNPWKDQPRRVEIWSEKGTVRGTLNALLNDFFVPFQVLHGYNSATLVWDAAQASKHHNEAVIVIYVGDFDPSGLHSILLGCIRSFWAAYVGG